MKLRRHHLLLVPLALAACVAAPHRDATEKIASVTSPIVTESCREDVGKLPVEISWLQAPLATSETPLVTSRIVQLAVRNAFAGPVQVKIMVRSTAQPRQRVSNIGPVTITTEGTHIVNLPLDQQVDNLATLSVSGRLDAVASVQLPGETRAVDVASAPVYFHQNAAGTALLYGEDVLRRKHRAGILSGTIDPRVADLGTALEVVDVASARNTTAGGGR